MPEQLDIVLINVGSKKKVYQELSKDFSACEPPFWCALTAGFIRNNGFSVEILDANGLNLSHPEAAERIVNLNPKITAIVVYGQQANTCTPLMEGVRELASEIKKRRSQDTLIVTGWHTSALPERTLQEVECDLVSKGEGFYTLVELLQGLPYDQIRGLYYWDGDLIRASSRPQENVPDLSKELCDVAWAGATRHFSRVWDAHSAAPTVPSTPPMETNASAIGTLNGSCGRSTPWLENITSRISISSTNCLFSTKNTFYLSQRN